MLTTGARCSEAGARCTAAEPRCSGFLFTENLHSTSARGVVRVFSDDTSWLIIGHPQGLYIVPLSPITSLLEQSRHRRIHLHGSLIKIFEFPFEESSSRAIVEIPCPQFDVRHPVSIQDPPSVVDLTTRFLMLTENTLDLCLFVVRLTDVEGVSIRLTSKISFQEQHPIKMHRVEKPKIAISNDSLLIIELYVGRLEYVPILANQVHFGSSFHIKHPLPEIVSISFLTHPFLPYAAPAPSFDKKRRLSDDTHTPLREVSIAALNAQLGPVNTLVPVAATPNYLHRRPYVNHLRARLLASRKSKALSVNASVNETSYRPIEGPRNLVVVYKYHTDDPAKKNMFVTIANISSCQAVTRLSDFKECYDGKQNGLIGNPDNHPGIIKRPDGTLGIISHRTFTLLGLTENTQFDLPCPMGDVLAVVPLTRHNWIVSDTRGSLLVIKLQTMEFIRLGKFSPANDIVTLPTTNDGNFLIYGAAELGRSFVVRINAEITEATVVDSYENLAPLLDFLGEPLNLVAGGWNDQGGLKILHPGIQAMNLSTILRNCPYTSIYALQKDLDADSPAGSLKLLALLTHSNKPSCLIAMEMNYIKGDLLLKTQAIHDSDLIDLKQPTILILHTQIATVQCGHETIVFYHRTTLQKLAWTVCPR